MKTSTFGTIISIEHSVVSVGGLPAARPAQVVKFENDTLGQVIKINEDKTLILAFEPVGLQLGSTVSPTKHILSFPASNNLLGTICSPLGQVISNEDLEVNQSSSQSEPQYQQLDISPPSLEQRAPIVEPLITGIRLSDLVVPLAKGQREVVVGGRKTGKSLYCLTAAITQAKLGEVVIYAAINKQMSEVKRIWETFSKAQVTQNIIIIASFAHQSPALQILTPQAAMATAEFFRDQAQSSLVIFDDLTAHAELYREISLIMKKFPGRDSYPGDIFFQHARLLERAGNFKVSSKSSQTASISALIIAESSQDDLTDYIVSNLISITDGHLWFDQTLFQQGRRPAIHTGLSVTRVGKQTQTALFRSITQELVKFFNDFQNAASTTHFAAEVSPETQRLLQRGQHLLAFFNQTKPSLDSLQAQVGFICVIWHGWLSNLTTASLEKYRDQFFTTYQQDESFRTKLDQMIDSAQSFAALLTTTQNTQQILVDACQNSNN